MKKILFIATGGTIACGVDEGGLTPRADARELLSRIPELGRICEISAVQPFSLDSTNMAPERWVSLAELIRGGYSMYDGFVIAHGTDTMGYAAAALSCMIQKSGKPIVLTGSQLPMRADGTDAVRNLRDAFLCACSDDLYGVYVVFCGRLICGERARKVHTRELDAFRSIDAPDAGRVENGIVLLIHKREKPQGEPLFRCKMDSRVMAVKLIPGAPPEILSAAENCGAVVIEGFGMGGLPDYGGGEYESRIARLLGSGVRVIMTTQVPEGGCDLSLYRVGREISGKYRITEASGMTAETAAMKAMWALAHSHNEEEFERLFSQPL